MKTRLLCFAETKPSETQKLVCLVFFFLLDECEVSCVPVKLDVSDGMMSSDADDLAFLSRDWLAASSVPSLTFSVSSIISSIPKSFFVSSPSWSLTSPVLPSTQLETSSSIAECCLFCCFCLGLMRKIRGMIIRAVHKEFRWLFRNSNFTKRTASHSAGSPRIRMSWLIVILGRQNSTSAKKLALAMLAAGRSPMNYSGVKNGFIQW